MKIRVLFFGATALAVGARQLETMTTDAASPADVLSHLAAEYPDLKFQRLLLAVNEEYVDGEVQLKEGDELAIFTPVSGG